MMLLLSAATLFSLYRLPKHQTTWPPCFNDFQISVPRSAYETLKEEVFPCCGQLW
jgi:hypothetical protein